MKRFSVVELKRSLGGILNRAESKGERVVIHRRGKDAAALISMEDLKLLERLIEEEEDRIDIARADAVLAELAAGGQTRAFEDVCRELGLDHGAPTQSSKRSETGARAAAKKAI